MRKFSFILPTASLLCGLAGFYIRGQELKTAFEPDTGLAIHGAKISTVMMILSVAVVAAAIIIAIAIPAKYREIHPYERLFAKTGFAGYILIILCGAAVIAGGAIFAAQEITSTGSISVFNSVFSVFAVITGVIMANLGRRAYKGRAVKRNIAYSIPSLFLCIWLIMLYKENTANPVLTSYCYLCLAYAAGALTFYYETAVIFQKIMPGKLIAVYTAAVFFETTSLADNIPLCFKLALGGLALSHVIKCGAFIRGLAAENRKPEVGNDN